MSVNTLLDRPGTAACWVVLTAGACLLLASCSVLRPSGPEAPRPPEAAGGTLAGFRIQIETTTDKPAADQQVEQALAWWRTLPQQERPASLPSDELPVTVVWQQPYYRVRIGNFTSREAAQRALPALQERFPGAFIVPDTVTLGD